MSLRFLTAELRSIVEAAEEKAPKPELNPPTAGSGLGKSSIPEKDIPQWKKGADWAWKQIEDEAKAPPDGEADFRRRLKDLDWKEFKFVRDNSDLSPPQWRLARRIHDTGVSKLKSVTAGQMSWRDKLDKAFWRGVLDLSQAVMEWWMSGRRLADYKTRVADRLFDEWQKLTEAVEAPEALSAEKVQKVLESLRTKPNASMASKPLGGPWSVSFWYSPEHKQFVMGLRRGGRENLMALTQDDVETRGKSSWIADNTYRLSAAGVSKVLASIMKVTAPKGEGKS